MSIKWTAKQYTERHAEHADGMMPIRKARKDHACSYCDYNRYGQWNGSLSIASGSQYLNDLRDASVGESGARVCIPCAIHRRGYLVDRRRDEVPLSEHVVWLREGVDRRAAIAKAEQGGN